METPKELAQRVLKAWALDAGDQPTLVARVTEAVAARDIELQSAVLEDVKKSGARVPLLTSKISFICELLHKRYLAEQ